MFIRQECGPYPDESHALLEALRGGVTADLMRYKPAELEWEPFAARLQGQLQSRGVGAAEGAWAVDAWARALGRHPEAYVEAPAVKPVEWNTIKPASDRQLKIAMTAVVAAGGGLGSALGAVLVPAALLLTTAAVDLPLIDQPVRSNMKGAIWTIIILVLILLGVTGFIAGAIGGAVGWLFGKGDRGHWMGFSTAFGAGFTSAALGSYFCGIFGSSIGGLLGSFCAATTTARRGGLA
jgi:hypothetical protein